MKRIVMALTLGAALSTSVHADQPLSLVSKDGRLVVTDKLFKNTLYRDQMLPGRAL